MGTQENKINVTIIKGGTSNWNEIWQPHVIGEIYPINQLWNDQVYKANKN